MGFFSRPSSSEALPIAKKRARDDETVNATDNKVIPEGLLDIIHGAPLQIPDSQTNGIMYVYGTRKLPLNPGD